MLLLLLSNQATTIPPIDPTWRVCENGMINFQECLSGAVTIQHDENGKTAFITEVNGWV